MDYNACLFISVLDILSFHINHMLFQRLFADLTDKIHQPLPLPVYSNNYASVSLTLCSYSDNLWTKIY